MNFLLDKKASHIAPMQAELETFLGYLQLLETEVIDAGEKATILRLKQESQRYIQALQTVVSDEAILQQLTAELRTLISHIQVQSTRLARRAEQQMDGMVGEAEFGVGLMSILIIVSGLLTALLVARVISRPVIDMARAARELSTGNLTDCIGYQSSDELGELAESLNQMLVQFREMIGQMKFHTADINTLSSELVTTSQQLSDTSEIMNRTSQASAVSAQQMNSDMTTVASAAEQATVNVQHIAAATEEMTSTVTEIGQSMEKTRQVTTQAVDYAAQATARVERLGVASESISTVTAVISEIAEQTKLLALNATIEAARAGDLGKGFAGVSHLLHTLYFIDSRTFIYKSCNIDGEVFNRLIDLDVMLPGRGRPDPVVVFF